MDGWRSLPSADASPFSTSNVLSLPNGLSRSISGPLLSKLQTETRLFVTLCEADWTLHSPTFKVGVKGFGAFDGVPASPGVEDRLPLDETAML